MQTTQVANEQERQTETQNQTSTNLPLIALCLGFFLVMLDATAVNVALPQLGFELHAGITGLQWIVDGYTLVFASLLLSIGALADRFGSKGTFQWGLSLFVIASVCCGLATELWMLIVFRLLQGLGAALMVPTSLALIQASYPDKASRARAIGTWGSVAGIAAAGGPTIGGLLTAGLSWRAVFFINVPVGVLGLILTARYVTGSKSNGAVKRLDLGAQMMTILGLGGLAYGLIEAGRSGFESTNVMAGLLLFVVATVVFLLIERSSTHPMLPLSLFRIPAFSVSNFVGIMLNLGFYGELFVLSLYFQKIYHLNPLLTGLAMLPQTGMAIVASNLGGRMTGRVGPRRPIILGMTIGALGFLGLLVAGTHVSYWLLIVPLLAVGFGTAFTMPAATASAIEAAPPERAGVASGALNTSRQIGGVVGVALFGTFVAHQANFIEGMHVSMIIATASFLLGGVVTGIWMRGRKLTD